ncbi:MAG: hypothetical protein COU65_04245 [Candidatus Pacebacteria bacterium CG10_big_fil_rev_8_21_14_0_10_42_12]|nr:MAG: hypothetical protein COU65_04245 [Candidatus Pacebacteria bacterium CG10_big_fil_rev_8_21_14_0_10_42_12]
MKKPLILPKFKNENEERDFLAAINLADYYDPSDFQPVSFPNLKPTSRPISIRLPEMLLNRIKERANEANVPYQSLIKSSLHETFFAK